MTYFASLCSLKASRHGLLEQHNATLSLQFYIVKVVIYEQLVELSLRQGIHRFWLYRRTQLRLILAKLITVF